MNLYSVTSDIIQWIGRLQGRGRLQKETWNAKSLPCKSNACSGCQLLMLLLGLLKAVEVLVVATALKYPWGLLESHKGCVGPLHASEELLDTTGGHLRSRLRAPFRMAQELR